jgi:hypothetical protein
MRRRDDMLWKGVLDEVIDDLIQFFFPRARRVYDMKRGFEFLDKELPERYLCYEQGSELSYKFNTLCVKDYGDDVLVKSDNPFALVLLIAKSVFLKGEDMDEKLLKRKIFIAKLLFRKKLIKRKHNAILTFLNNYIQFEDPEKQKIFMKLIHVPFSKKKNAVGIFKIVEEMKMEEGLRKGERKGQQQERRRIVKRLLESKRRSAKEIAAIVGVSVAFVENVRGRKKRTI